MRDFLDTLPLRLAAVVAAVVGAICLWQGIDLWVAAGRIGISFVALLLVGLVVRRVVLTLWDQTAAQAGRGGGASAGGGAANASGESPPSSTTGNNVDYIAPGTR